MLWPLLHYMIWNNATDGRLESKQWEAYLNVNRKYADFVLKSYKHGDIGMQTLKKIKSRRSYITNISSCSLDS